MLAIVPYCPPTGCGWEELKQLIQNIMQFLLDISVPLAVAVIIYGGFLIIASGGSENRIETGKKAITSAVVGLLIVSLATLIVKTVTNLLKNG
jgi:type III secretory pathway component EscT